MKLIVGDAESDLNSNGSIEFFCEYFCFRPYRFFVSDILDQIDDKSLSVQVECSVGDGRTI